MGDASLTITTASGKGNDVTILALNGPLTLPNMFLFQETVANHTPRVLIVDLTESPYMDSAGLGAVMNAYVRAKKNGRKLLLACANERVNALLELTKVNALLKNYPTVAEAEASARG